MDGRGKGKGLFGVFRRSRTPSPQQTPEHVDLTDDSAGSLRHPHPVAPSASHPNPPPPIPKKNHKYRWNKDGTLTVPKKFVSHGTTIRFQTPDPLPQHSPRDEEEQEESEEEPQEEEQSHAYEIDDDVTARGGDHDEQRRNPEINFENDESEPMEVESPVGATRGLKDDRQRRSRTQKHTARKTRDTYEEHLRAAYDFPSEQAMLREVERRSRQDFFAPPPIVAPPPIYAPPPPPYPMYPPYAPYTPFTQFSSPPSYSPYPSYHSTYDSPRSSYAGPSSRDYFRDPPRRSFESYED